MHSVIYLAVSAFAALAAAQSGPNAFNVPNGGWNFGAGESTKITWDPSTKGTVTLKLQKGSNITPGSGIIIAENIANSGTFEFTPPSNLGPGADYNIQILDDDNPENFNFTPPFAVADTTGTGTGLPTAIETDVPSGTATDSSATGTTSGASETTGSTDTADSTETSMTSMTTTDSSATTSDASSSETASPTSDEETSSEEPTESSTSAPNPDGDGAMAMGVPAGLLTGMLAIAALL